MLKKALLANVNAFKVSIGTQTHCTISSNKTFASPGEIITISVSYPTGYSNATVSVSPSVTVNKKNSSTYTFVMPSSDVTVTASASVRSFSIYVNKSGSGTVNVRSVADYGEWVTVTLSPANGHSLQSISSSDVSLSGSGNTRTFVMPARNVTLTVAFQQDYHVVITVGVGERFITGYDPYGYSAPDSYNYGSIDRIPYWNNPGSYLTHICSQFFYNDDNATSSYLYTPRPGPGLSAISVNGISLEAGDRKNPSHFYKHGQPPIIDKSLKGKELRIKFDPPPTGYL